MKHFGIWQWTDHVLGLSEGPDRSAMEAHLSSGCSCCQRTVNILKGVAIAARGEAEYEPPQRALAEARLIYALHRPESASFPRLLARLVHDSFREPLAACMRGRDGLSRRALYVAGSYSLDLQLEHQLASGVVTLMGQLADRDAPATNATGVPVWLMERKSLVASTVCNRFGEFQLEYAPAPHLRLSLPLGTARKRLEVSLNRVTPGLPSRPRSGKITHRQPRRRSRDR